MQHHSFLSEINVLQSWPAATNSPTYKPLGTILRTASTAEDAIMRNRPLRISDEMVVYGYLEYKRRWQAGAWQKTADEVLKEITRKPMRVIWRAMRRACHRGYIEFGVSMHTGWATKSGIALLMAALTEPAPGGENARDDARIEEEAKRLYAAAGFALLAGRGLDWSWANDRPSVQEEFRAQARASLSPVEPGQPTGE